MNLKESDIRLLNYLYHNNREPATKIAKATKLTRDQVEYKLKKYQSEGIIKQFFTLFNYEKLGYNISSGLLLKIKPNKIKEFSKSLTQNKNCLSKGKVLGDYDFYMDLIFKDEKELNEYISNLFKENQDIIFDYLILRSFFIELYPLKFLGQNIGENTYRIIDLESSTKKIELDDKDKIIMKMFSEDARVKIVDIAHKLKISPELTLYKIRRLEKEKIILGSRMFFDVNKLGYYLADILLEINNFSLEVQEKIKKFAKQNKNINNILLFTNKPNCLLQIIFKSQKELQDTIEKIKELFEESVKMKILFPQQEEKINSLPFY
mgnify:CR=1 FL=1|jgi:DNA-binding Lrp family transcriptional regulator|tara:strand:+ start:2739 stop:3701 length:963 start_codon:yes stop_codon:yes gene_type:complete